jgi:hypothetical protein
MTRTVAALLAAASIAGLAAPATAQTKYFVRERLMGLSKTAEAAKPVGSTCGSLTNKLQWSGGGPLELFGTSDTLAGANDLCAKGASTRGQGVCQWNVGPTIAPMGKYQVYYRTSTTTYPASADFYATSCQ